MNAPNLKDNALAKIERYALDHNGGSLTITFQEGDSYECRFDTNDWDNNDKDLDDPQYEEWFALDFEVLKTLKSGPNKDPRYDYITISEKHMPSRVTCDDEEVVYQPSE